MQNDFTIHSLIDKSSVQISNNKEQNGKAYAYTAKPMGQLNEMNPHLLDGYPKEAHSLDGVYKETTFINFDEYAENDLKPATLNPTLADISTVKRFLTSTIDNSTNPLPPLKEPLISSNIVATNEEDDEFDLEDFSYDDNVKSKEMNAAKDEMNASKYELDASKKLSGVTLTQLNIDFIKMMTDTFVQDKMIFAELSNFTYDEFAGRAIVHEKVETKALDKLDKEGNLNFTLNEIENLSDEITTAEWIAEVISRTGPDGISIPLTIEEFQEFRENFKLYIVEKFMTLEILPPEKQKIDETTIKNWKPEVILSRSSDEPKVTDKRHEIAFEIHKSLIFQDIIESINKRFIKERDELKKEEEFLDLKYTILLKEVLSGEIKKTTIKTEVVANKIFLTYVHKIKKPK